MISDTVACAQGLADAADEREAAFCLPGAALSASRRPGTTFTDRICGEVWRTPNRNQLNTMSKSEFTSNASGRAGSHSETLGAICKEIKDVTGIYLPRNQRTRQYQSTCPLRQSTPENTAVHILRRRRTTQFCTLPRTFCVYPNPIKKRRLATSDHDHEVVVRTRRRGMTCREAHSRHMPDCTSPGDSGRQSA